MSINMNNSLFFVAKILNRYPSYNSLITKFNQKRHQVLLKKLTPLLKKTYKRISKVKNENVEESDIVWFFWWQGEDHFTELTSKCYQSIQRNIGKRKLVLITKYNIRRYTTLPEYIYKKVDNGQITLTHLSDILRFNLLCNYGGLWMDATIYATGSLDQVPYSLFTCSGYREKNLFNISDGNWTGFFIGGPAHTRLFYFMDKFFQEYWKDNEQLIDYFLIDYALDYAWKKNISNFQKVIDQNKNFAVNLFKLQPMLNDKYNLEKLNKITVNTSFFKLSNRKKYIVEGTFFEKL